jgi:hypothetical protein
MRTVEEAQMPHSDDRTLGTLERVGARPPVTPLVMGRRATTLVGLARPAGKLAGLLVLEVLQHPRARRSAVRLARSLVGRLADRRSGGLATARLNARRVTVAEESRAGGVLVRRVETAIVVFSSEQSPDE